MISFKEACAFVEKYHRHHLPPKFHKFSIAVNDGQKVVGVIMVNRPVNITLDDGWTLEVSRCCTDGTKMQHLCCMRRLGGRPVQWVQKG